MDTKPLEAFAKAARRELIGAVEARVSTVLAAGSIARSERAQTVSLLESAIADHGREHVVDKVAYTWFNRLIALRFMDARGYTDAGVVSPASGQPHGQPEILSDAKRGDLDTEVVSTRAHEPIVGLLEGTRRSTDPEGEAYALLLTEYCRHWHKTMPFMFEAEGAYTELLVPTGLLADDSVLMRAREVLTAKVCDDVEVIGWLYQFYISERKDEVFAGFKKNKKAGAAEIPAATQLFTPHWIVRYLVENSVGRLWMLNHPESRLVDQMDYYIAPVDEEADFLTVSGPEELTVIDPACGSGHMLTYAFDLLYAIYEEQGYAPSDIPGLILAHNLYGTEIDPRAGALAAFALTMKARARQRTFFSRSPAKPGRSQPNICIFDPISFTPGELDHLVTADGDRYAEEAFWNQFAEADTFGSLIRPDSDLTIRLARHLGGLDDGGDMFRADALARAARVVLPAEYLARRYAVAIANPPYMGGKQMNALLSQFMKDEYPTGKADLFAAFIERCADLALLRGVAAMITMQSWMFLSSYEKLRASLFANQRITSMLHLGARAFDSIGGEVVSSTAFVLTNQPTESYSSIRKLAGTFIRLVDGSSEAEKVTALGTALREKTKDAGFNLASGDDFTAIPGSPVVYWLTEKMRGAFQSAAPLAQIAPPKAGLCTDDDARFLRHWWEVSRVRTSFSCGSMQEAANSGAKWFPFAKGGGFCRWYGLNELVVNFENAGVELSEWTLSRWPSESKRIVNKDLYFTPGLTWGLISSSESSFRVLPPGFVFGHKGPVIPASRTTERNWLASLLNSSVAKSLLGVLAPTIGFEIGQVSKFPVVEWDNRTAVNRVDELVSTGQASWDSAEISWNFGRNPLIALADTLP